MLQQMVDEEKGMRDSYYENIIKCREECIRLSKELETEFKECTEELSVMKKEKHFRNQVRFHLCSPLSPSLAPFTQYPLSLFPITLSPL